MYRLKLSIIAIFAAIAAAGCLSGEKEKFVISTSKTYPASMFRQHCAICHGPEAEGRTLDNGTIVPSLRTPPFKAPSEAAIHKQIAEGGNGMPPFSGQLSARELDMMTNFVYHDLRGN